VSVGQSMFREAEPVLLHRGGIGGLCKSFSYCPGLAGVAAMGRPRPLVRCHEAARRPWPSKERFARSVGGTSAVADAARKPTT